MNGWRDSRKRKWKWYNIFPELTVAIETYFPFALVLFQQNTAVASHSNHSPETFVHFFGAQYNSHRHLQNFIKVLWGSVAKKYDFLLLTRLLPLYVRRPCRASWSVMFVVDWQENRRLTSCNKSYYRWLTTRFLLARWRNLLIFLLKILILKKQFHCSTHQLEKACNEWPVGSSRPLLESLFDFEIIHLCKYENCD